MSMVSNYHHFLILCLLFSISISSNTIKALNQSFTIDLIHRDSPQSPFFNPSETPSQRWMNAFECSIDQAKSQENFNKSSTIFTNSGYYLLEFTIGTPPSRVLVLADTGSDLVWIQCQPCSSCYPQTLPIFQPTASNTYKNLPCSDQCKTVYTNKFCNPRDHLCHYSVEYGGASHTEGKVATDTLTLASTGGPVSFSSMVFGCGNNNSGFDRNETGIVGLGGGPESLISQISNSIDGKFSYCLVPINSHAKGKMSFGRDAVVSGDGAVTTPLVSSKNLSVTFYFTTLQAISVGNQRFKFVGDGNMDGNMIVVVSLRFPGTGAKELPEEYRGRKRPQYSLVANIAKCCPISIHKGFCGRIGTNLSRSLPDRKEVGRSKGTTGLREGDWRVEYQAGIARLGESVGGRTV
ncbi:hypothetical protein UlMin_038596 [Ulmus minor]